MIENIVKIIMCHMIGDYVLQTDYMAREKANSPYVMIVHCVCYCVPFAVCFGIDARLSFLFFTHFWIDYLKAKLKAISLSADQLLHYFVAILYILM